MTQPEQEWVAPPWCAVDRKMLSDLSVEMARFSERTESRLDRIDEVSRKTYEQACKTNGDVKALKEWRREVDGRLAGVGRLWHFVTHDRRVLIPLTTAATWLAGHIVFGGRPLW